MLMRIFQTLPRSSEIFNPCCLSTGSRTSPPLPGSRKRTCIPSGDAPRVRVARNPRSPAGIVSRFGQVESAFGKVSGSWVFKDTRMPVSIVFENLEAGATIDEIMEWFDVTREQVVAVLEFAARSLDAPPTVQQPAQTVDAYTL